MYKYIVYIPGFAHYVLERGTSVSRNEQTTEDTDEDFCGRSLVLQIDRNLH